ncbi:aspartate aminotransferase family protein [Paenibacillus herberti]|uniref:Aspartate aminotransferase family protein n=1 Tax=Paenibacillus herberti TaxID=1619309 RepID=A0A229P2J3_9BACL|nr:aspartate aminotransferase family protein [Paenibacillus herberti]OXM16164.1 aspartate aminotransferase family protein [Paenibacillus herberti]
MVQQGTEASGVEPGGAESGVLKSDGLLEKDRRHLWHNMRPYRANDRPLVIVEAMGSWVTDHEGNRYLDGMSGLWCVNVGYGRKELADAAARQLQRMPYYPLTQSHLPAIELAEKLGEWLEGDYVVFFANSGSEANETAFKIARQYQQHIGKPLRSKFIARYRGYHGSSLGALAATGQAIRKQGYEPLAAGFLHVRPPDSYRRPEGMTAEAFQLLCAREIEERIIWEGEDTVAGVIMEPVITGGGIIVPDQLYVDEVRRICTEYGVLLIIDEVICGFGRSGRKFGHHNYGIAPDIVTMAKGLTSGYLPLASTAVKREIYEAFQRTGEYDHLRHVNTFGGNPAACALAMANLEVMEKEQLPQRAARLGEELLNGLKRELADHPYVGDIRGFGLLIGIELVEDRDSRKPAAAAIVQSVIDRCRAAGLIISKNGDTVAGMNNVLTTAPPLSSTDEDMAFLLTVLVESVQSLRQN